MISMAKKEVIQTSLSELKSIIKQPRVYLTSYFDDLCNQIDTESIAYLEKFNDDEELKESIIENQAHMINEVKSFESKCLSNTEYLNNEIKNIDISEFENQLESFDFNSEDMNINLMKSVSDLLIDVRKRIFMRSGIVFIDNKRVGELFDYYIGSSMYGIMILVEDEFINLSILR